MYCVYRLQKTPRLSACLQEKGDYMKSYFLGLGSGLALAIVAVLFFVLLTPSQTSAVQLNSKVDFASYTYVDFRYEDLVLNDVGVVADGEVYVKPDKLLSLLGKTMDKDERSDQLVIGEKPENVVLGASTAALGQFSKGTIGDMLSQKFQSQHWDADPEEENKLVFRGLDLSKNHYEIVFWINKSNEMTIQTIYINGNELSEQAKIDEMKRLFNNN